MNRRQLFVSSAKAGLATAFASFGLRKGAFAQACGPFNLTIRVYQPEKSLLDGNWNPPSIKTARWA